MNVLWEAIASTPLSLSLYLSLSLSLLHEGEDDVEGGSLRERHDAVEGSVGGGELGDGSDGLGEAVVAVGPLVGLEARRRRLAEPPTAGVNLYGGSCNTNYDSTPGRGIRVMIRHGQA